MSAEPQLFRINPENRESEKIAEVEFASLGFQERRDIQEWVAANPGILGEDLLIIGKEFSGFDRTDDRLDLLAVDADGRLVVIELKRDDSGADAHWQAIKYASYIQHASADDIIRMLAEYIGTSEDDATSRLLQHLNADDLNSLNNDQRIILASHRFAPEVTSAALWLNEKAPGDNLISCVQLTPYQDGDDGPLYVQASTVIPVPGVDDYIIGIGESSGDNIPVRPGMSKLAQTFAKNRGDAITRFLRGVSNRSIAELGPQLRPDKTSRWAGGNPRGAIGTCGIRVRIGATGRCPTSSTWSGKTKAQMNGVHGWVWASGTVRLKTWSKDSLALRCSKISDLLTASFMCRASVMYKMNRSPASCPRRFASLLKSSPRRLRRFPMIVMNKDMNV